MNKITHFIYIPLTDVGITQVYRNNEWLKYRIDIFKQYTLKSLVQQTAKNFIIWISARPEEYNNPDIIELEKHIKSSGLNCIMTFDGLMYWDDKFSKDFYSRIKNIARIGRKCWRTKNFSNFIGGAKQIFRDKNGLLEKRLTSALGNLKNYFSDTEYVYVTRIDSDDMFKNTAVEIIQSIPLMTECLIFNKGLVYNKETKELYEWVPRNNPPFHTIIFKQDVFYDAKKYLEYFNGWKSHEDTPKIFTYQRLPDYHYCVLVHNKANQISTVWNHPFRGKEITEEKEKLLALFGIE